MLAYLAAYNGHFAFIRMLLYAGDFCPYACFYVISFYDAAFQRKHFANGSCGNELGLRDVSRAVSTCL